MRSSTNGSILIDFRIGTLYIRKRKSQKNPTFLICEIQSSFSIQLFGIKFPVNLDWEL